MMKQQHVTSPAITIICQAGGVVNINPPAASAAGDREPEINKLQRHKSGALRIQAQLEAYYSKINPEKAAHIADCGNFLIMRHYTESDKIKLHKANFCHHPLCPLCAWRRHLRDSAIITAAEGIVAKSMYVYHLTLTVRNRPNLSRDWLDQLKKNAIKFLKSRGWMNYYLSYEITYSKHSGYHPHLHILIATYEKIIIDLQYIHDLRADWGNHWGEEWLQAALFPVDDVGRAAAELTKYLCKPPKSGRMPYAAITEIAENTKGIQRMSSAGEFRKAVRTAKTLIKFDRAAEEEALKGQPYEDIIFNWICGKYKEQRVKGGG